MTEKCTCYRPECYAGRDEDGHVVWTCCSCGKDATPVDELQARWGEVFQQLEGLYAELAHEEKAAPARELEVRIDGLEEEKMLIEIELAGW
jgi:hypothetical protein